MRRRLLNGISAWLLALQLAFAMIPIASADVLVFGGTRGVGLETVRLLRESGEAVTVMVRPTSDLTALNEIDGVATTVGDALVMGDVTRAYESGAYSSVVSTLGGTPQTGAEVDSVGNIHAMDGATAAGVQRFVLITAIGAGDSRAAAPAKMLRALAPVLAGKELAERHLIDSGLTFTIIRPGALMKKPANGRGILTQDSSAVGLINRAELARLIVEVLSDEQTHGRIFSAIEPR
jgi:uncharacterized protein YbjT (DUF2867 family)